MKSKIQSWGGVQKGKYTLSNPCSNLEIINEFSSNNNLLPFGMGKSYGDVCLNSNGKLISLSKFSKILNSDFKNGIIHCQSGITLKAIQDYIIPNGWMLPVAPGTQYISLGGAIANDVHGKNHFLNGSFGNHVSEITIQRSDESERICSIDKDEQLFRATIGGVGLTGIIVSAQLKLVRFDSFNIKVKHKNFDSLEGFKELALQNTSQDFSVSWINCKLGSKFKGVMQLGSYYKSEETIRFKKTLNLPLPKIKLINAQSKIVFNNLYSFYNRRLKNKVIIENHQNFMHPLDRVKNWNRLYGKSGFFQFQCHLPPETFIEAMKSILKQINTSNLIPFLPVIKSFGVVKSIGLLSFPKPGITFSVDFENNGHESIKLIQELSDICVNAGGRIYLAKDCLMSEGNFRNSYPNFYKFKNYRDLKISSSMSRRLMGF